VFIDDEIKVLIDPGAGLKTLTDLTRETSVDVVVNTHYHYDHIAYIDIIDERDRKILSVLTRPLSLPEIVAHGLIYSKKHHIDAWIYMWEFIMIKKHVRRMTDRGQIRDLGNKFVAA